ncbi:hypothetical protein CONCODRAFT_13275 [Conidiobolus coronatus NRRL 28638]|uniref:Uncharacterized protein n=1 Tax=Conidiobolus coronatus (strain ATCC 28846 / CBS 209.66 / NRRL 28638) TaxID=796925 RepID=A0A137NR61_CONC2|nr:hypothetical protein CONCODRAFT_13275 [Conidiobolus coronatus NRRL 28638]|eukprot:KXN65217.1 hypothetical protein CONCODRAFT_13275 [Conidiobolus coronatus NRRL 28638]
MKLTLFAFLTTSISSLAVGPNFMLANLGGSTQLNSFENQHLCSHSPESCNFDQAMAVRDNGRNTANTQNEASKMFGNEGVVIIVTLLLNCL